MQKLKLSIIGGGNMATAILEGLFNNKLVSPDSIMVTNRSAGKLERLQERWPIKISYNDIEAANFGDVIILAVKPVDMKIACEQVRQGITRDNPVVSVAAGVRIDTLKKWLGYSDQPIIRVMPNMPAQIGLGISGWTASEEVNRQQIETIRQILRVLGHEIYFEKEDALDQVTAISGSGPAYIFYLAELLTKSGKEIGLTEGEAKELVLQMIYGAASMLRANGKTPAELRIAVTSKGGTTEAALREFTRSNLDTVIMRGVEAAYIRGKEIGQQWANS